jgi:hypothetical protein
MGPPFRRGGGVSLGQSESELLYDWRFTATQFVLAPSILWLTTRVFFCDWTLLGLCQMYNIYKSFVSPGSAMQIMPILFSLCYNGSLVTWTVISLTAAKFKPLIFSVWIRLVHFYEHVRSHDFVWPLLVTCTILLRNRIHTEGWKLCANRGTVCTLKNFQWCGEPCFAGVVISRGGCLPQIPRRGKHKSSLI